jgi:hypothetical protein
VDSRNSQIAIQYAYKTRDRYPHRHVFWVYAANATRLDRAYQKIAGDLKLEGCGDPKADTCQLVHEWLNGEDDVEWLMIVDNGDVADLFSHQSRQGNRSGGSRRDRASRQSSTEKTGFPEVVDCDDTEQIDRRGSCQRGTVP